MMAMIIFFIQISNCLPFVFFFVCLRFLVTGSMSAKGLERGKTPVTRLALIDTSAGAGLVFVVG